MPLDADPSCSADEASIPEPGSGGLLLTAYALRHARAWDGYRYLVVESGSGGWATGSCAGVGPRARGGHRPRAAAARLVCLPVAAGRALRAAAAARRLGRARSSAPSRVLPSMRGGWAGLRAASSVISLLELPRSSRRRRPPRALRPPRRLLRSVQRAYPAQFVHVLEHQLPAAAAAQPLASAAARPPRPPPLPRARKLATPAGAGGARRRRRLPRRAAARRARQPLARRRAHHRRLDARAARPLRRCPTPRRRRAAPWPSPPTPTTWRRPPRCSSEVPSSSGKAARSNYAVEADGAGLSTKRSTRPPHRATRWWSRQCRPLARLRTRGPTAARSRGKRRRTASAC